MLSSIKQVADPKSDPDRIPPADPSALLTSAVGTEQAMARREDTTDLDAVLSEPEDRHTLAESITGRLRQLILDGQLRPGQALRPADLAPRLGVSAMPVREALRI